MEARGNARSRLRAAALFLFRERGYDRTTAAEIAERAGVTERTFFRYFADKREVLFDGEVKVRAALVASIAEAPSDLGPLETIIHALRAFQPMLEESVGYAVPRQALIFETPALRERELAKIDALASALSEALKARGVAELRAVIAAHIGMVILEHATTAWLKEPEGQFNDQLDLIICELNSLR